MSGDAGESVTPPARQGKPITATQHAIATSLARELRPKLEALMELGDQIRLEVDYDAGGRLSNMANALEWDLTCWLEQYRQE
jgi:hypothetical protein